ncbi:hypothetical protein BS78_08G047800 [Paspalum vaginatum]|nr:hypothetical protein BS78_08G047800 [Paspalum vaginatum]
MLWDSMRRKFNIPQEHQEKVEGWTLKKMGELFHSHKKKLYEGFKKNGQVPDFNKFPKYRGHWEEFISYKESEEAIAFSAKNKASAKKKEYHHRLGPGDYKGRAEGWATMEVELERKGITPVTHGWPRRLKRWYYGHAGSLAEDGSLVYKDDKAKEVTEKFVEAVEKSARGEFVPDREKDELTLVLQNLEHPGRTRGYGNMLWKYTFAVDAETYRSRHGSKAIQEERVRNLKNELAQTKASIPNEVARQVVAAIDSIRMQGLLPPPPAADMFSLDYPGRTRVHGSSCASTELPDQRYPIDEIQHQTSCEIHIAVMNLTTRVAYGMALPPKPDQKHHGEEIPKGYSVVNVEEVCEGFGDLELPIPGGDGAT